MYQQLISRSPDLKKLRDKGFQIEIKEGHLLIHSIPYVTSNKEVKYGILVSTLTLSGDKTITPDNHVVYFKGEYPCHKDGHCISEIKHNIPNQELAEGILVNHSFSNKPDHGYKDYYDKMTRYIDIISNEAKSIDKTVTAKTFKVIESEDEESVFNYIDTNSSRAGINTISEKLKIDKIAIIGLGGTGSYVLDLISKTPVKEIHLFDGDDFLQHNAFRAPSAPSFKKLNNKPKKTDYFKEIYSQMHKNIYSNHYCINSSNIDELKTMDFIFICIDANKTKKILIDYLEEHNINFIDVGISVYKIDDQLLGNVRTTLSINNQRNDIKKYISFTKDEDNEYSSNIQIAELNMFNATMAVIKWKKFCGFYQDLEKDNNSMYSTNNNLLV